MTGSVSAVRASGVWLQCAARSALSRRARCCELGKASRAPNHSDRGTCLSLVEPRRLQAIDGEREIVPGISIVDLTGHTPGHIGVRVEDGGQSLIKVSDMIFPVVHPGATECFSCSSRILPRPRRCATGSFLAPLPRAPSSPPHALPRARPCRRRPWADALADRVLGLAEGPLRGASMP